jgi:hypothetical protein
MANEANRYHLKSTWLQPIEFTVHFASDQELEQWAHDPNCIEMEDCAKALAGRVAKRQPTIAAEQQRRSELRKELEGNPFNPRTEVSADAIHIASRIVKHLWIIFVLLPFVAALLWAILVASK